jgi:heptosyltransferase-1
MRVLIVKVSALGDIIHALPVLDYLHKAVPGIQVDWVVEEQNQDILDGHPLISNLICINTRKWRASPFSADTRQEIVSIVKRLRTASYDAVFDIQGNIKSGVITWLSCATPRYGFAPDGVREKLNLLCTTRQVPLRPEDHHVSCRALRVASEPFGGDFTLTDLHTDIATSVEDDCAAREITAVLPNGPWLMFHNGTTWTTKLWHTEAWIELGRLFTERFPSASILLSWGSQDEFNTAEDIREGIGPSATILPRLSLKQLCALMKRVNLVVGGDTGPVHIAAAVGTPTVSFYRVTDPLRNAPVGSKHLYVQTDMHCRECLQKQCEKDDECRRSISAGKVFELVERLLKEGEPHVSNQV